MSDLSHTQAHVSMRCRRLRGTLREGCESATFPKRSPPAAASSSPAFLTSWLCEQIPSRQPHVAALPLRAHHPLARTHS